MSEGKSDRSTQRSWPDVAFPSMRLLSLLQLASASGYALRGAAPQPAASAPLRRARSLAMMPNSILEEAAEAAVLTDPRSSTTPAAAAECAHGGGDTGRSALILGWFFAKDRELEYVRRMCAAVESRRLAPNLRAHALAPRAGTPRMALTRS